MTRTFIRSCVVLLACVVSTACGTGGTSSPGAATPSTTAIRALPAARGPVVLEISGVPASPRLVDLDTLDSLATKTYKVVEPFEKRLIAFKGVELWTVLQGAGIPADAKSVELTALDDYQVEVPVKDIRNGGVILATRADGNPIGIDEGGPTRLVFADGVDAGRNPDQWIWSVSKIVVQ